MDVLKNTSSSYLQNMIENMILTSYLDRCFLLVMTLDSSLFLKYHLAHIPRQREEYEVIYGTRRNAECHITSILRAGVEYLFYYTPNSQS